MSRDTFFLGIDPARKRTLPWCGFELRAGGTAADLSDALGRLKPKPPAALNTMLIKEKDKSGKDRKERPFFVQTLATLEAANDARAGLFLRGLLWNDTAKVITSRFRAAIVAVFTEYARGGEQGVLDLAALDRLQYVTNQESFGADNFAYALEHYESREMAGARGLTLVGLVQLYGAQAEAEPQETWLELSHLGFDLTLERGAFLSFDEALAALHPQIPRSRRSVAVEEHALLPYDGDRRAAEDVQIVRYAEYVAATLPGLKSPTALRAPQLPPDFAIPAHAMASARLF